MIPSSYDTVTWTCIRLSMYQEWISACLTYAVYVLYFFVILHYQRMSTGTGYSLWDHLAAQLSAKELFVLQYSQSGQW
jgi:multidrug transporter EmrE-like cation transporter